MPPTNASASRATPGLLLAVASAAAFATSGPFVKPLLDAGWSPVAAVAVRAAGGGLVLLGPALFALRGRFALLVGAWRLVVAYGVVAVAGVQVAYFAAIERLPVAVALLVEYLGPVLLVLLAWGRTRRVPPALTLVGTVVSVGGLALVINPTGSDTGGLDLLGLVFAFGAAIGVAVYYLLSAAPTQGLPPVTLVSSGLLVGALSLGLVGGLGVAPFEFSADRVALEGIGVVPWVVPMAVVVVVSTAFAYFTGLLAAGVLGSRVASFVGLFEVLFAVVLAWLLLAEVPTYVQALGGAFVVAGVVLVKLERDRAGSGAVGAPPADAPPDDLPSVIAPGVDSLPVALSAGIAAPRGRAGGAADDEVRREHQLLDGR